MPQHQRKQVVALAAQVVIAASRGRIRSRIASCTASGNPDPGQLAGPMQPRQCHRIAPVRLHPLTRSFWDQGGGDYQAIVPNSWICRYNPYPVGPASKQTCK